MKNLILGGAGFIGKHLSHKLLKQGESVIAIDNLSTSTFVANEFLEYSDRYSFVQADIVFLQDRLLKDYINEVDRIFYLASSVGVDYIVKNPKKTLFNNYNLSHKIVSALQGLDKHVVFTSTSELYGNGPFNEESHLTIGSSSIPRYGYSANKLITEFMLGVSDFPSTIVRFFNVVGRGQSANSGMVLPRFINSAKAGDNLVIYGDGQQTRSFCHVDDALNGLLKVISNPNQTFNIGNDNPISIKDLAKLVIEISGSSSKIEHIPFDTAYSDNHKDISNRVPDLEKIRKYTDYEPKFNIKNIIEDLL